MVDHVFLSDLKLGLDSIHASHRQYLLAWNEKVANLADEGIVAASLCYQAASIDLFVHGKLMHDWLGVMDEYLMADCGPLAYSENYGNRLHKFSAQYLQSTVHSIYSRWWIDQIQNASGFDNEYYAWLVLKKRQGDGLFYDQDVSPTILRHRMKVELTMSMAMTLRILDSNGMLSEDDKVVHATNISCPKKCPALGYISMEYFRYQSLKSLGHLELFPNGVNEEIKLCTEGLEVGWNDFSMRSKVDAYMGTAKRVQRDKPIHSPLIAFYVLTLLNVLKEQGAIDSVNQRLSEYAAHLRANPMSIPAFQMRDVPIAFGVDITPIEAICASYLMTQC